MDHVSALLNSVNLSLLPVSQLEAFTRRYEWLNTARPDQLPPSEYFVWLLMGGRGSGKTRAGAEDTWWPAYLEEQRIAVIGPTNNDVRKTCFEGESGLLARIPKHLIRNYNRTSLELWTHTLGGGVSYYVGYSAEEPERLRGPQHHRAWCDETAAWAKADETWDMLMFGLRLGKKPNVIVTTTPRPVPLIRMLVKAEETVISRASTYDNADHLPDSVLKRFRERYEGTRMGRQELNAELLEDITGGLWNTEDVIYTALDDLPEMERVVVAVDPSGVGSGHENGDRVGIVVAGLGVDELFYVLADLSVRAGPDTWARNAVDAFHKYGADRLVAETNFGGAMVESVIRTVDKDVAFRAVKASRGKVIRAEPVAALYEQKRVRHVTGLDELETQMFKMSTSGYTGGGSPDRVDALVWAITALMKRNRIKPDLHIEGSKQENWAKV